jgi:hypothetical protein
VQQAEPQLQLEPNEDKLDEAEPGTPPGSAPPTASAVDPGLFALATALPPAPEDRGSGGGHTSPRTKEVRQEVWSGHTPVI